MLKKLLVILLGLALLGCEDPPLQERTFIAITPSGTRHFKAASIQTEGMEVFFYSYQGVKIGVCSACHVYPVVPGVTPQKEER